MQRGSLPPDQAVRVECLVEATARVTGERALFGAFRLRNGLRRAAMRHSGTLFFHNTNQSLVGDPRSSESSEAISQRMRKVLSVDFETAVVSDSVLSELALPPLPWIPDPADDPSFRKLESQLMLGSSPDWRAYGDDNYIAVAHAYPLRESDALCFVELVHDLQDVFEYGAGVRADYKPYVQILACVTPDQLAAAWESLEAFAAACGFTKGKTSND